MTKEELALLVRKPINQLENVSGIPDGKVPFYTGDGVMKLMDISNLNNISKSAKPIAPADAEPTEEGLYIPTVSGTYANLDGLVAQDGYYTLFFFDGTDWTKSESKLPGVSPASIFDPTNNTEAQTGVTISEALSDFILFSGQNIAEYLKTNLPSSENSNNAHFMTNDGTVYVSNGYFISAPIEIKGIVKCKTKLGTNTPAICIYDENDVFIAGKNASQMTNTSTGYVERDLSDDFNLVGAKYFRTSCADDSEIFVTYSENIVLPPKTLSELDFESDIPINSNAVKDIAEISNIAKDIEMLNTFTPYVELADTLMKGWYWDNGADPQKTVSIISRNSDYSFTVNPLDITTFVNGQNLKVIIFNGVNYVPIGVLSVNTSTGVFTTSDILPSVCTSFQHLWGDSIHLSKFGYNAMAEKVAENLKYKLSQRKNKVFGLYGYQDDLAQGEQNWIVDGETVLVMQKLTADTVSGGYVDSGNTIFGTFANQGLSSDRFLSSKYPRHWQMSQNKINSGLRFTLPIGVNGYTKIVWGCDYRPGVVTGSVKIKITDNSGNIISDENLTQKGLQVKIINHNSNIESLTFEISLLANETTIFTIDQIEVFKTYFDNSPIIKEGDKTMYFGDSWNVHTTTVGSEVSDLRPDGSALGGLGIFPNKLSEILGTVKYNFSRGGQTSEWGRFWIEEMIKRCPLKPDYCFINLFINDCNSANNWDAKTPSVFDFSPTDPYSMQMSDAGGIFGSTNVDRWLSNMQYICATLRRYDIKPIIIGYPQLGGVNYEYAMRNIKFLQEF